MAQTPTIDENGVVNAASFIPPDFPGGAVAPGSVISIFGTNLGPAAGIQGTFPLQAELGGTSVLINDSLRCHLLYVAARQVNCQLPQDLQGDQIHLRLRTRDQDQIRESAPVTVPLAGANVSLFSLNGNGRGPAAALNRVESPGPLPPYRANGPSSTARPGQVVLLFGTGLGATNPAVPQGQASSGLAAAIDQPQVLVGGVVAQVQYAGRAPGYAGLDQIQIVLPPNVPTGCSVPVRLRIHDRLHNRNQDSNVTTLAIHATALACAGPVESINHGSHGSVVLASGLGQLGPGQQGPGGRGGTAAGGAGPIGYGIHPGIPPHAFGFGFQQGRGNGEDVVAARFVRFGGVADIGIPPAATDACLVYYQGPRANPDLFLGAAEFLDAGVLTVQTPLSSVNVLPDTIAGVGVLYVEPLPHPLSGGTYTVSGGGGVDVGPFGPTNLSVPTLVNVTTNLADGTAISRSSPFSLAWSGGGGNDIVVIHGRSYRLGTGVQPPVATPWQFRSMAFICTVNAAAGQFTVPGSVLNQLPLGQFSVTVSHMPSADGVSHFAATGLELGGTFRWLKSATYPNLLLTQ